MERRFMSMGSSSSSSSSSKVPVEKNLLGLVEDVPASMGIDLTLSLRPPAPPRRRVLIRICTMCGETNTPLWRTGPFGPKSLCNACGIRYRKEELRQLVGAQAAGNARRPDAAGANPNAAAPGNNQPS